MRIASVTGAIKLSSAHPLALGSLARRGPLAAWPAPGTLLGTDQAARDAVSVSVAPF